VVSGRAIKNQVSERIIGGLADALGGAVCRARW
jgi:hypothetical protein